jgi:hypothetical protein
VRRAAVLLLAAAAAASCAGGPECTKNSDCTFGEHCAAGTCYAECRGNLDCMHGLVCDITFGRCTSADADGGTPPPGDGGNPQTDAPPHPGDGPLPQTDGPPAQSDAAAGTLHYTDSCQHGYECDSNLCLGDIWGGPVNHCLPATCAGNTQCQMGDSCVLAKDPINHNTCLPQDSGRACSAPGECLAWCLTIGASGFCTSDCSSAADCPAEWSCYPVLGSPVCLPPDPSPCADPIDCVVLGVAACIGSAVPGRCLNPCRAQSDCEAGATCQAVANTPAPGTYCLPASLGTGLLGAACNNDPNQCRSGLCLGTFCTEPCGVTHTAAACPHGYGCLPVDNGAGGQTLVCTPAGSGELGAPCANELGCRSALCVSSPGFCSRFCNDNVPCPTGYTCQDMGLSADGIALRVCAP